MAIGGTFAAPLLMMLPPCCKKVLSAFSDVERARAPLLRHAAGCHEAASLSPASAPAAPPSIQMLLLSARRRYLLIRYLSPRSGPAAAKTACDEEMSRQHEKAGRYDGSRPALLLFTPYHDT